MNRYEKLKENARQKAIDWQADFESHDYSYGEIVTYENYFENLGRRYGLLTEFRENGIC